jgi:hypothetical protein
MLSVKSPLILALTVCGLVPVIRGQSPSAFGTIVDGKLTVGLLDRSPQIIERSDIAKLPHKTIKVKGSGGKVSFYSGVPLEELLEHMGAVFGKEQRQASLGSIVLVESVDHPSVLFAMAEFDTALTDKQILLADSKDGKPLTAPEGPFRIIVPDEKEPTRWAKQVWAIYVVQISEQSKRP